MSELKPKFSPAIQQIYEECGTYITSDNAKESALELEYFVEQLVSHIVNEAEEYTRNFSLGTHLKLIEFLKEKNYD